MFSLAILLLCAAGSYVKCEELIQPASVALQPGQPLTITCQVSYSLGSYYTGWIRQRAGRGLEWIGMKYTGGSHYKDSLKNKFSIDLDPSRKIVTLNGQNMQNEDTAVYYCARGNYAFDVWGKGTTVTITSDSASAPTVFPLSPCSSASSNTFTLACLATGYSPASLTFSWTKSDTALTDFIQYPSVLKGSTYTGISHIQVAKQDWDKRDSIKCLASNSEGRAQAGFEFPSEPEEIYVSPTLKVCSSSDEESEITFSCVAKDFSPKEYNMTWLKNAEQVTGKIDEIETVSPGRAGNETTLYSAASFLTVDANDWAKGTTYTCVFEGKGEDKNVVIQKSVTFKETSAVSDGCREADVEINIEGPRIESMSANKKGTLTCKVKVNKGSVPKTYWENSSGKEIAGSQYVPTKAEKKEFHHTLDITYDEWMNGEEVSCVILHDNMMEPMKKAYKKSTGTQTSKPTVFMLAPLVHNKQQKVTLTCFVKDFSPQEVFVSWLVNDEEAGSDYEFTTTSPVESKGSYFAYSQLTLSLNQWSDTDTVYSCAVYHESLIGNITTTIVRSIDYRTFDKNNVVNLSMNVPDNCKSH